MKCDAREFTQAAGKIKQFAGRGKDTVVAIEATGTEVRLSVVLDKGSRVGLRAAVPSAGKDRWKHYLPADTFARCASSTGAKGYGEVTLTNGKDGLSWEGIGEGLKFNVGPLASVGGGAIGDDEATPAFEFDGPPYADAARFCILDCAPLCAALREAVAFATRDDSRPILTAVYVVAQNVGKGKKQRTVMDVVTNDTYRLYQRRIALPPGLVLPDGLKAMLPGAFCGQLTKETSNISLWLGGEESAVLAACANVGEASWYGRALEGRYVNYQKVVPVKFAWEMQLDIGEVQGVLRAAMPIAAEDNNRVVLTPKGGQLLVRAEAVDRGEFSGAIAMGEAVGEPVEIALNVKYALDFLKLLDSKQPVTFKGNGPVGAMVWTGTGRDPEHDEEPPLYCQMPMQIM